MIFEYIENLENYESEKIQLVKKLKTIISKDTVFFCIGTDKVIFDSLGPLVGHKLKLINPHLNVYGTLKDPITAINITDRINEINNKHNDSQIVAIDASICKSGKYTINSVILENDSVQPGKGLGRNLPKIGDYKIIGVVDTDNNPDMFRKNIRLYNVILLADFISDSIITALE